MEWEKVPGATSLRRRRMLLLVFDSSMRVTLEVKSKAFSTSVMSG